MRYAADRGLGRAIAAGAFECAELACAMSLVGPGDTAIDGGAHLGVYALSLAQRVGISGQVHAFEPHPETRTLLSQAVVMNGFAGRVLVHGAALGDASHRGRLRAGRQRSAHAHACLAHRTARASRTERLFPIDIVSLDAFEFDRRVALLKLDVEGAELLAIRGATALIRRHRPAILCELGDEQLARVSAGSADQLMAALTGLRYRAREIRPDGSAGAELDAPPTARVSTVLFLPAP